MKKPRLARAADLDTVADLTRRAYAPHEAIIGRPPTPVTENYAPRIAKGEVWLLDGEREPVGLLVREDRGDCSLIFSVAVAPERQSAGIGRNLLAFAEEIASERGHNIMALYINARFERNLRIYADFGYRETRRETHTELPSTVVVHMEKPLAPTRIRQAS